MTDYFLDRLARFSVETTCNALPPSTVHQAKRCVLDLLGCALGAIGMGCNEGVRDYTRQLGGHAEARLWGDGAAVPAPHAALANGAVAHHLELDDGHLEAASHPGISTIPAALASAEVRGASGRDVILAVVVGYEVAIRAGLAMAPGIREHLVHGPGMIGPLGAAAAVSRLRGYSERDTAAALAIAGSLLPVAPYESFVEGAPSKDLYGGWAGFTGTIAADLALCGMDGPHRFVEGNRSVGKLLLHGNAPSADALLTDLGEPYLIEHIYFKPFSACRSVQPAVTGILDLKAHYGFKAGDIESIEVEAYPYSSGLSEESSVRTPVTARLNIPYTVARAILTGGLDPDTFTDAALSDEETLALAARVTVSTAERYGAASTGARSCVVTVRLRDGTTLTTEVVHSRWDRHLPPSDAELEAKFDGLARRALGPDEVVRLKSAIWGLDELGSIAALTDILAQARERVA